MIVLLVFTILNVVVAQSDENTVYLHEWGIVQVDQEYQSAIGAARGYVDLYGNLQPFEMTEVEAPVVWFHGAECTGTLTVTANTGYVTTAVPWYDEVEIEEEISVQVSGNQTVRWLDLSISSPDAVNGATGLSAVEEEEAFPRLGMWDGFDYAVPFWRSVESNTIQHPGSGYTENFLYYECSFRDMTTYAEDLYGYQGVYLLFFMDDSDLICASALTAVEMDARGAVLDDEALLEILAGWSGNELETSELLALWDTWRPAIRYRCSELRQTVMLFPLTEDQVESICSIEFQPDGNQQVEYSRLFLGLGEI